MKGVVVIVGHFALMAVGVYFGLLARHTPAPGDRRTLFAGLFFVYWAVVLFVSSKRSDDWLLAFLNSRGNAMLLAALFALAGVGLVIVGALPRTAP